MKTKASDQNWRRNLSSWQKIEMSNSLLLRGWPVALLIALSASLSPRAQSQHPTLNQLRADFAMHFLEPAPHMALAKYYLDHGNRLQAFYILETARRSRFEEPVFNQAFQLSFHGFD